MSWRQPAKAVPGESRFWRIRKEEGESLTDYLANKVFHETKGTGMDPVPGDVEGYEKFMERYTKGLAIERAAVENL